MGPGVRGRRQQHSRRQCQRECGWGVHDGGAAHHDAHPRRVRLRRGREHESCSRRGSSPHWTNRRRGTSRLYPYTGTSINPARSIASALFDPAAASKKQLWIFVIAPIFGGALGGGLYQYILQDSTSVLGDGKKAISATELTDIKE